MSTLRKKMCAVIGVIYLCAIIFTINDAWLYHIPIAKITKVETNVQDEISSTRGTVEIKYTQNIKALILNGRDKGSEISLSNEYTDTGMVGEKYNNGDKILLSGTNEKIGKGIRGLKRDTEFVILLGFLIWLLAIISGKKGILTIVTVTVNIIIFVIAILKSGDTSSLLRDCTKIVFFFSIFTLIGLNGFHKRTFAAIISTVCVLAITMGIFDIVVAHVEELDYSTMEYMDLRSIDYPDEIFRAEILLTGLGAIMDVAVAISAALGEVVMQNPKVTYLELFKSGRKMGYDIMGTMMNVLMCVLICGLIPMCLIRMNNGYRLLTIMRLYIPCEICRFLVESIGIVLTIPVSVLAASLLMKIRVRGSKKDD